jgi:DNA-binding GntR family transcriptional regulator
VFYRDLPAVMVIQAAAGQRLVGHDPVRAAMALSESTGASVATVKRAFAVLHEEGVIYSVNGRGTFVSGN